MAIGQRNESGKTLFKMERGLICLFPIPIVNGGLVDDLPVEAKVPDNVCELIELDRFDDVAVDAEVVTVNNIPFFTGRGEDDHRDRSGGRIPLDLSQYLEPVHLGKLEVEEDHLRFHGWFSFIGTCPEKVIKRFFAVPGHVDPVGQVTPLEDMKDKFYIIGIILNQEYL
jgi:hypothetical protein